MCNGPQGGFTKKTSISLPAVTNACLTSSVLCIAEKLRKEMNATFPEVTLTPPANKQGMLKISQYLHCCFQFDGCVFINERLYSALWISVGAFHYAPVCKYCDYRQRELTLCLSFDMWPFVRS